MRRYILMLITLCSINLFAQDFHHLIRLAAQDGNAESILYYASQVISESPKDVDAHYWSACAHEYMGNYQQALQEVNLAIKYWNKKDTLYDMPLLLGTRARIHEDMDNNLTAYNDYTLACKKYKKSARAFGNRGEFLYRMELYQDAASDFAQACKFSGNATYYLVELARCCAQLEKYDAAITFLEEAINQSPDYAEAVRLKAVVLFQQANYKAFVDEYLKYFTMDSGDWELFLHGAYQEYAYTLRALNERIQSDPDNANFWLALRVRVYQLKDEYKEALEDLDRLQALTPDTIDGFIEKQKLVCYYNLQDMNNALIANTRLMEVHRQAGTLEADEYITQASILERMQLYSGAIFAVDSAISYDPTIASYHSYKGDLYERLHMNAEALECYNKAVNLNDSNSYYRVHRGRFYVTTLHDNIKAKKDFEYVVNNDTVYDESTLIAYAYYYLGHYDKALEALDKVLEILPESQSTAYNAACIHSLIGNTEKALSFLRHAFELGYNDFHHIDEDSDLDNIRQLQEFKDLIHEFDNH